MSTAESSPATVLGMFVGGAWRPSASGETFEATSPATGEVIGPIAQGDRADARPPSPPRVQAFPGWAAQTAFARAAALHRVADVCERRRDELARALTLDQGKPLHAESYDEVDELLAMLRGAAEDGVRLEGSIPPSASPGKRVLLMRRPQGPVAVVTPWNWPYTMPAEIVAPALAAGNTVVWTPAPSTAVCSALLAECVAEADLPPGVFNFVPGPGAVVGDEIVANPGTVAVGFIGSTATGRRIAERAAGKRAAARDGRQRPARGARRRRRRRRRRGRRERVLPVRRAELHGGRAAARARGRARRVRRAAGQRRGGRRPPRRPASPRARRWARSTTRPSRRRWTSTSATPSSAAPAWSPAASAPTASPPTSTGRPRSSTASPTTRVATRGDLRPDRAGRRDPRRSSRRSSSPTRRRTACSRDLHRRRDGRPALRRRGPHRSREHQRDHELLGEPPPVRRARGHRQRHRARSAGATRWRR